MLYYNIYLINKFILILKSNINFGKKNMFFKNFGQFVVTTFAYFGNFFLIFQFFYIFILQLI